MSAVLKCRMVGRPSVLEEGASEFSWIVVGGVEELDLSGLKIAQETRLVVDGGPRVEWASEETAS